MRIEMTSRGPDSAGVAIYRDKVGKGLIKLTLAHDDPKFSWKIVDAGIERALKCDARVKVIGNHAILVTDAREQDVIKWLDDHHPEVRVVGSGRMIEIFKEVGLPVDVAEKVQARGVAWFTCRRTYTHGDGECRDDGGVASFRDRCGSSVSFTMDHFPITTGFGKSCRDTA